MSTRRETHHCRSGPKTRWMWRAECCRIVIHWALSGDRWALARACWPRPSAVPTRRHLPPRHFADVLAARRGTLSSACSHLRQWARWTLWPSSCSTNIRARRCWKPCGCSRWRSHELCRLLGATSRNALELSTRLRWTSWTTRQTNRLTYHKWSQLRNQALYS